MPRRVLLISLDAISDSDVNTLLTLPTFSDLVSRGRLVRAVSSVPTSNTYPNHVSISTGEYPSVHGIWSNTCIKPDGGDRWNCHAKEIKVPTIFNILRRIGKKSSAILWPVTGGERDIDFNLPEMHVNPGQNQLIENLRHGSAGFQLQMLGKFLLSHLKFTIQTLDSFALNCACEVLRRHKPDLLALHLIAADTIKHKFGPYSTQAENEVRQMDKKLSKLITVLEREGLSEDTTVIVMGDHACLPVKRSINLNDHMRRRGLLKNDHDWQACFHLMGGSAALMVRDIDDANFIRKQYEFIQQLLDDPSSGVSRIMPAEQFERCGFPKNTLLCVEAADGVEFHFGKHKGNHGYFVDRDDYKTFYMVSRPGIQPEVLHGGEIREIFNVLCSELVQAGT